MLLAPCLMVINTTTSFMVLENFCSFISLCNLSIIKYHQMVKPLIPKPNSALAVKEERTRVEL